MSGGSFDYFCFKDEAGEMIQCVGRVEDLANFLRENGKHDAADEVEKFVLDIKMFKRMMELRHKRLEPIFHAAEWWSSGDMGETEFDEVWQKFLGGKK